MAVRSSCVRRAAAATAPAPVEDPTRRAITRATRCRRMVASGDVIPGNLYRECGGLDPPMRVYTRAATATGGVASSRLMFSRGTDESHDHSLCPSGRLVKTCTADPINRMEVIIRALPPPRCAGSSPSTRGGAGGLGRSYLLECRSLATNRQRLVHSCQIGKGGRPTAGAQCDRPRVQTKRQQAEVAAPASRG